MSPVTSDFLKAVRRHKKGVVVACSVHPRSAHFGIAGVHADAIRIKLTSPPVDGKANAECCSAVAKLFKVAKSRVAIIKGQTSRQKSLLIEGLTIPEVLDRLKSVTE